MARHSRYPGWADWLVALEAALGAALTNTGLTQYRLNGQATNMQVSVKSADQHQGSMPYVEVVLAEVQDGWDDNMSGQEDYGAFDYTNIGGNQLVKTLKPVRERITFQIDINTQKQIEAVVIADTIKRQFNTMGELQISWQGEDLPIFTKLHSFSMEAVEANREGKIENFRASWLFTFSIISEQDDTDLIAKAISTVVAETITSIGGDSEDSKTKTLS